MIDTKQLIIELIHRQPLEVLEKLMIEYNTKTLEHVITAVHTDTVMLENLEQYVMQAVAECVNGQMGITGVILKV